MFPKREHFVFPKREYSERNKNFNAIRHSPRAMPAS